MSTAATVSVAPGPSPTLEEFKAAAQWQGAPNGRPVVARPQGKADEPHPSRFAQGRSSQGAPRTPHRSPSRSPAPSPLRSPLRSPVRRASPGRGASPAGGSPAPRPPSAHRMRPTAGSLEAISRLEAAAGAAQRCIVELLSLPLRSPSRGSSLAPTPARAEHHDCPTPLRDGRALSEPPAVPPLALPVHGTLPDSVAASTVGSSVTLSPRGPKPRAAKPDKAGPKAAPARAAPRPKPTRVATRPHALSRSASSEGRALAVEKFQREPEAAHLRFRTVTPRATGRSTPLTEDANPAPAPDPDAPDPDAPDPDAPAARPHELSDATDAPGGSKRTDGTVAATEGGTAVAEGGGDTWAGLLDDGEEDAVFLEAEREAQAACDLDEAALAAAGFRTVAFAPGGPPLRRAAAGPSPPVVVHLLTDPGLGDALPNDFQSLTPPGW